MQKSESFRPLNLSPRSKLSRPRLLRLQPSALAERLLQLKRLTKQTAPKSRASKNAPVASPAKGRDQKQSKLLAFTRRDLQQKLATAIPAPGRIIMTRSCRAIFAVGYRINHHRVDTQPRKFLAQRKRAPFTQRAIIFFRAAFVAVTFDLQP